MSAYKDAQAQNNISRNVRQYSDLDLFFTKKTVGSDVNKVTDIQAVKRSLRNLINLNAFEKPFHPEISGGVREMLFENMTPGTLKLIEERVVDTIEIYEPRAELIDVAVEQIDEQQVNVTVLFYVTNEEQPIQLDVILERNR